MQQKKPKKNKVARMVASIIVLALAGLWIYHLVPVEKIPTGVYIDRMLVVKSERKLYAYSGGKLIVTYAIALGKQPLGAKEQEGDFKTPEGLYVIDGRNAQSGYHKNLAISYPNEWDKSVAAKLGKPTGGDIKIHGLENGKGYIGKFHRLKDWTNGCIALTDEEVDELYEHVPDGTIIEIRK